MFGEIEPGVGSHGGILSHEQRKDVGVDKNVAEESRVRSVVEEVTPIH